MLRCETLFPCIHSSSYKGANIFSTPRTWAGSARLSTSGRALNITIGSVYYTVPLRVVLAVLDGRNRKGAVFVGK
jgi:hypothetical protein